MLDWGQGAPLKGFWIPSIYLEMSGLCQPTLRVSQTFFHPEFSPWRWSHNPQFRLDSFSPPSWTPLSGNWWVSLISLSVRWNFFLHHIFFLSLSRAHKQSSGVQIYQAWLLLRKGKLYNVEGSFLFQKLGFQGYCHTIDSECQLLNSELNDNFWGVLVCAHPLFPCGNQL